MTERLQPKGSGRRTGRRRCRAPGEWPDPASEPAIAAEERTPESKPTIFSFPERWWRGGRPSVRSTIAETRPPPGRFPGWWSCGVPTSSGAVRSSWPGWPRT